MKVVYLLFIFSSPIFMDDSFLQRAQHDDELKNQTGCWICGLLPTSGTSGLLWRVSRLQGTDRHSLHALFQK